MTCCLSRLPTCLSVIATIAVLAKTAAAQPTEVAADRGGAGSRPTTEAGPREHRLHWRWRRFGVWDYVATGALGAAYFAVEFGTKQPPEPKWTGAVLFDAAARDSLVADTYDGRARADRLSDYFSLMPMAVLWAETLAVPVLFDDNNWDVVWHLTVINLQSSALSGLLTRGGNRIAVRERPDVSNCHEDPDYSPGCYRGETASFPSGHTSMAFLGAGLSCAHHLNLGLYGNGAADSVMCIVLGAGATATGMLRVMADRHYVSDTLTGAAIGIGSGFVLPMLLHYSGGGDSEGAETSQSATAFRWTVAPLSGWEAVGLSVYGWF